jgi:hypothetical protein
MGKDRKSKGKQSKGDPKDKDPSSEGYVPSAADIAEDKQARLSAALLLIKKQPAHPLPIRMAPPSAGLPLAPRLEKEPKEKAQKDRRNSVDKNSPSSVSSEEPVLNTDLNKEEKEDKKTAEVKPGTSPTLSTPSSKDASLISALLDKNGTVNSDAVKEEGHSPVSDDPLGAISPFILEEPRADKQDNTVITAEDLEDYIQVVQNNGSETRFWHDARGFTTLTAVDPGIEDLNKYIKNVLSHSHRWKDHHDIKCTMDGIDLEDQMARVNCKYTRNLYLRLGKEKHRTRNLRWQGRTLRP